MNDKEIGMTFGSVNAESSEQNGLALGHQKREIAEVQAQMIMARMNPRNQARCVERILDACSRKSLAEDSLYQYARGGTDISGPNIRLAETLAQNWGNLNFGVREIERSEGESIMEAFAWDLETNTRQTRQFVVPHVRETKKGNKPITDGRDIYEATANQGARRMRACILSVIPGDVVELATNRCKETMLKDANVTPEAVAKMAAAFLALGVTRAQIETKLQRSLDSITPHQIVKLRMIYASIKDGMSQPDEWFDAAVEGPKRKAPAVENAGDQKRMENVVAAPVETQPEESRPAEGIPSMTVLRADFIRLWSPLTLAKKDTVLKVVGMEDLKINQLDKLDRDALEALISAIERSG